MSFKLSEELDSVCRHCGKIVSWAFILVHERDCPDNPKNQKKND